MLDTHARAAFYPPRVTPAAKPLRFPANVAALIRNNVAAIPEQAYHDPVVIAPGPPRMAFFTGPEAVKALLLARHAEFPKGHVQNEIFRPLFGNAMLTSEGREWRWQRGAAAPLFRHEEILEYAPVMSAAAEATVAKWRAAPAGSLQAIHKDMMHAAFSVISNTMLRGGAADVLEAIEQGHADYYRAANWRIAYTLLGLPEWLPHPGGRAMRAHERRLRDAVGSVVRTRRRQGADGRDLVARLLASPDPESGREMSDALLIDNIVAFFIAGYDTTALALTWTLYLVAQSPEWEAHMLSEIADVVGTGPVEGAHVAKLVTVQQVVNESLRLFPTAPIIVRDIIADTELDGAVVPAGTVGLIPIYAIHRHRAYWADPDRFDPERFAPGAAKPSRYQFMPFGAGPRICIGAAFATVEMTLMLAAFVRAARFETAPDFDPQPSGQMFLFPRSGMPLRVTMRG